MSITTIELSVDEYMRVIGSSPVPITAIDLKPGFYYKLVNRATGTYMHRYLRAVVGEYTYWE
ncbi:hypothetical protein [Nostoc sp. TCL240-02]|uniref:hypothetical protein n=1 Tax=Nostoc sp. TCL240-02 TaxID=2572090 RepID=UPI00157FA552|nr:hypothetical protein [Nostoc sp. TCL240-02]QKQ75571.1 hypothetical protein FBB35_21810 [Nostoc sp. TCL240-02]